MARADGQSSPRAGAKARAPRRPSVSSWLLLAVLALAACAAPENASETTSARGTGGKARPAGLDQLPESRETALVSEGGEAGDGACHFHISRIVDLYDKRKTPSVLRKT